MKLLVESHSGHKANQRPIKFWLGDDVHFVESVDDQWYGSEAEYFRLRADDGNTYVLSYSENKEEWTLEAFRSDRNLANSIRAWIFLQMIIEPTARVTEQL